MAAAPPSAPLPALSATLAPAKVNLYLHITGRRDDGYHMVDSLAMFADVGDELALTVADPHGDQTNGNQTNGNQPGLYIDGPYAEALKAFPVQDNLIIRAVTALSDLAGKPRDDLVIRLVKNLPLGGGIGGGSADAGAVIRLLCQLWLLDPAGRDVMALAAGLGADLPVCIQSEPRVMFGIGEMLTIPPVLPDLPAVLVNPGIAQPTPIVFKTRAELVQGAYDDPVELPEEGFATPADMAEWLVAETANGLTAATRKLTPVVSDVLTRIGIEDGALLSRMSGSGSTCFALFANQASAVAAASRIAAEQPDWWVMPTTLRGTGF
tara:strand:- start:153 stop:1121 length:969 start_codon:yes stop_codon:yes gene_type:complete